MRRGIRNYVNIRIVGMDLTQCSDITLFVEQNGIEYSFTGSVDPGDSEVYKFLIPKADAVSFKKGFARIQVALTDGNGIPRSHDPVEILMGNLLKEEGYGN